MCWSPFQRCVSSVEHPLPSPVPLSWCQGPPAKAVKAATWYTINSTTSAKRDDRYIQYINAHSMLDACTTTLWPSMAEVPISTSTSAPAECGKVPMGNWQFYTLWETKYTVRATQAINKCTRTREPRSIVYICMYRNYHICVWQEGMVVMFRGVREHVRVRGSRSHAVGIVSALLSPIHRTRTTDWGGYGIEMHDSFFLLFLHL